MHAIIHTWLSSALGDTRWMPHCSGQRFVCETFAGEVDNYCHIVRGRVPGKVFSPTATEVVSTSSL